MKLLWIAYLVAAPPTRIAVFQTQLDEGARNQLPVGLVEEAVLTAVQNAGRFEVIGRDDLQAVLDLEQQRDLLGCQETSCVAEIAGALDVDKVVTFKLARLEDEWGVGTKVISLGAGPLVEARVTRLVSGDVSDLLRAIPGIIRELFPTSEPSPPKKTASAPIDYTVYRNYIGKDDWRRWTEHLDDEGPIPLADWVYLQNQESTGLAITEALFCAAGLIGTLLATESDAGTGVAVVGWSGCVILPIFDAFDIGSVHQLSPPPSVATLPPQKYKAPDKPWLR